MAGLLLAAVASGRVISRIGRYRPFPIAGTAILVVGMYLLSLLAVDTVPWVASVYMLVVGVGIGLVMQVLVLVVQNDVEPQDIGVATSTATFSRSVGGSFGVAIFGAIFASRLGDQLAKLPASVTDRLGDGVQLSPEQAGQLPPVIHADFLGGLRPLAPRGLPSGMVLALIPFVLSWLLKEVPLRTSLSQAPAEPNTERPAALTPTERVRARPVDQAPPA